jgi:hypothetical protein
MDSDLTLTISGLYQGWLKALAARHYDWFERHLAEDYTMTAHPLGNIFLRKQEFIEVDKLVTQAEMNIVDLFVHRIGNIVVSNISVQVVKETFSSDPGSNFPTAEKLGELFSGKTIAYSSAWRNENGIWKCFDHHMVGPIT